MATTAIERTDVSRKGEPWPDEWPEDLRVRERRGFTGEIAESAE